MTPENRQRAETLAMIARHDDLDAAINALTEALDAAEARGSDADLIETFDTRERYGDA